MVNDILTEDMLEEAKKNASAVKQTLKDVVGKTHGTLTWGAGIGAFIGPVKDVLGDQAIEIGTENVTLLATALAASFIGEVGKDIYSMTMRKIKKNDLLDEFRMVQDKVQNDEDIDEKYAEARSLLSIAGKTLDDTVDIVTFTAFFTPIVDYISSLAGVAETPSPTAAVALIGGAIGFDLIRNLIKKFTKKEDNKMKVDELRQMIKEALQEKSFLLASPLHEAKEEDEPAVTYDPNEGRMAKAQLYKLMNYAHYLHDLLHDDMDLPEWVEAKITKACDYIGAVKHHLEYEFYRTGTPFEVEQGEKIPREATLDMLKGLAQRTSCPKTSKALMDVLHQLETDPQHQQDQPMEEEEQY
tara:strand:- start:351 stop:1418 length:1068 start_codon:yes stop_codon:yes gene_type:complete